MSIVSVCSRLKLPGHHVVDPPIMEAWVVNCVCCIGVLPGHHVVDLPKMEAWVVNRVCVSLKLQYVHCCDSPDCCCRAPTHLFAYL